MAVYEREASIPLALAADERAREEEDGEVRIGGLCQSVRGRALRLILWLAAHQARINETAPDQGQLWVTWKGDGARSITGDIRTPL